MEESWMLPASIRSMGVALPVASFRNGLIFNDAQNSLRREYTSGLAGDKRRNCEIMKFANRSSGSITKNVKRAPGN
jgi:hypothetical protein